MSASPVDHSALIFPSASTSITSTLTQLKRSNLSISNRLRSIASDAAFVERIADELDLPLIANERCGSWYIPTSRKAGSAYFKSTDGHHGQWAFSLRRLNVQVLDAIEKEGSRGCIIVDSTRKGKSMPDAMSKTVPIWICVLNRLLFPEDDDDVGKLHTPEHVVSRSEHEQIEQRVLQFVQEARSLDLDLDGMRARLREKPMLPLWVTPDSRLPLEAPRAADRNLIVLCTASSRLAPSGALGSAYVQGAADDSESWARGLDAALFWAYQERLLATAEDELPDIIRQVVLQTRDHHATRAPVLVRPTGNVWIGDNATAEEGFEDFDLIVSCSNKPAAEIAARLKDRYFHLSCSSGKVGSRQLRFQLSKLAQLRAAATPASEILFTCPSGTDLSVGAALAAICLLCDENGIIASNDNGPPLTKTLIKHRLSWIMVSVPDASPSRATLQSVNAFLLG